MNPEFAPDYEAIGSDVSRRVEAFYERLSIKEELISGYIIPIESAQTGDSDGTPDFKLFVNSWLRIVKKENNYQISLTTSQGYGSLHSSNSETIRKEWILDNNRVVRFQEEKDISRWAQHPYGQIGSAAILEDDFDIADMGRSDMKHETAPSLSGKEAYPKIVELSNILWMVESYTDQDTTE